MTNSNRATAETFDQKVARVLAEPIELVAYDSNWPNRFREEKERLLALLPADLITRIEHFGSTAVPGLAAKPIVDMLIEVTDLDATKVRIAPVLEARGYDYFWRPVGDGDQRHYAWFIRRDPLTKERTHHIHMVERDFPSWEALIFRDFLLAHPEVAEEYRCLKVHLASNFKNDREGYTQGKTEFIARVLERATR